MSETNTATAVPAAVAAAPAEVKSYIANLEAEVEKLESEAVTYFTAHEAVIYAAIAFLLGLVAGVFA